MRNLILMFSVILQAACAKQPDTLALPTAICATMQHHSIIVPDATIYIKYNVDTFPGYHQPDAYFDAIVKADKQARFCIEPVPEGTHWLIGRGYDSLYFPHDVYGSLRTNINLNTQPKLDTIFYLSE
jgi:hypothetical protein